MRAAVLREINKAMDVETIQHEDPEPSEVLIRTYTAAPEDIVQETFVKLALLEPAPEPLAPWLFRVARNLALNAVRSAKRRRLHEARAAQQKEIRFVALGRHGVVEVLGLDWIQEFVEERIEIGVVFLV